MTAVAEIECVTAGGRAAVLLQHPLRSRILGLAREPISASDLAAALGETRQKVNYHVRKLERARFLEPVDQRLKRNMLEHRFVATARAYVVAPQLLGPVAARADQVTDTLSASHLLALSSQMQEELVRDVEGARLAGKRLSTLSIATTFSFISPQQRADFTRALTDAVADVVARFTSPTAEPDDAPHPGRPYRLVVGCYPVPASTPND
jgi:hypothetical protein